MIDQVFFASMIATSFFIAWLRRVKWSKVFGANVAIMLFYGYFVASSLWSTYQLDSLIRVTKDFGATIVVISVILSEKKPLEAVRAVYIRCACVAIPLSAYLVRFSPLGKQYARNGDVTYIGAAVQKNSFGEMLLLFMIFLVWDHLEARSAAHAKRLPNKVRWDFLVLLVMGAWLLNLSGSQTSTVSLLIALALMLRTGWLASQRVSRLVFVVALSLPILLLCTQEFASVFTPLLTILGRDATFTGRTDIWHHITFGTVNPVIGAGYWSFWGGPGGRAISIAMKTGVPNAHDGYLDIFLDGGLIGLFLLSCVLIASGRRLIKNLQVHRYYYLCFAFLIIAMVHNLTESSFARLSALWFTTLLAMMDFPSLRDKLRSTPGREPAGAKSRAISLDPAEFQPAVDKAFGVRSRQEIV
ncbi:MAG: O-antigen ligase family protein [Acidobacteriia bacterium]|nr:O-antigen ligase family protein [Terriglobia bacterium]